MKPLLSLVFPYYENPRMLAVQYVFWEQYANLPFPVEVLLVDDGSPESPAIDVPRLPGLPPLSIYRHTVDKPWHQHAARNRGADEARGEWLLLTDMDHVITAQQLLTLFAAVLDPRAVYTFGRVEPDGSPTLNKWGKPKHHPNSFLMTREMFWHIGGYDEAYCGHYGTDGLFIKRAQQRARLVHLPDVLLVRYSRACVPDASTRTLQRKEGRDPRGRLNVATEKRARGAADKIETLTIPCERQL